MDSLSKCCLRLMVIWICVGQSLLAAESHKDPDSISNTNDSVLFSYSIQELLDLEVTSASKKPQRLSQTTAAIFVITQEDIRRSGASNIPEALRMAPGVQVANIDANKWAISIRGFNGRFANKLLVLIDGRTIYTPTFSGVYWDTQDTLMSDIERIEVVRGPGGTLWGTNAVNGVINVITKSSTDTDTGSVSAVAGNHQTSFASRLGAPLGADANFRVFAKYKDIDGNRNLVGDSTNDDWRIGRIGGRVDWQTSDIDEITLISEAYDGKSGETLSVPIITPPFEQRLDTDQDVQGAFVLGRWERKNSRNNQLMFQSYVDYSNREGYLYSEERTTIDLEAQQRLGNIANHDIVVGLGYRINDINIANTPLIALNSDTESSSILSFFVQDEIIISPDRLSITLGTRLEHNELSSENLDWMPSIRGLWRINATNSAWSGVTRAIRTPSYVELDGQINTSLTNALGSAGLPPVPYPVVTGLSGNPEQQSEELMSYELGYRVQPNDAFSVDVAVFHNDYDNLRSLLPGIPTCEPSGAAIPACLFDPSLDPPTQSLLLPAQFANEIDGKANGAEIAIDWLARDNWRMKVTYSYLDLKFRSPSAGEYSSAEDPKHQFSVQSQLAVGGAADFDIWLRYVDDLDYFNIDSYWTMDARLAWRVRDDLELSIAGKNLLESGHVEFASETEDIPITEIERSYLAELRWSFE